MEKILEISEYANTGWGTRVKFVNDRIKALGHDVKILNIGKDRKIKRPEYIDVQSGIDYVYKILKYLFNGYKIHMHVNGDSPKGFILTLLAELLSILFCRRCILTFHAGPNQLYFPKQKAPLLFSLFLLIFYLPKKIICNSEKVKEKIKEYYIPDVKIKPIPAFSIQYLNFNRKEYPPELEKFIESKKVILFTYLADRPAYHIEFLLHSINKLVLMFHEVGLLVTGIDKGNINFLKLAKKYRLEADLFIVGDPISIDHNMFLSILEKSTCYIRTYSYDGICSSILEALSLKIPIIASENGTRPKNVVTYKLGDVNDFLHKLIYTINNIKTIKNNITTPKVQDTVIQEVDLLINA